MAEDILVWLLAIVAFAFLCRRFLGKSQAEGGGCGKGCTACHKIKKAPTDKSERA